MITRKGGKVSIRERKLRIIPLQGIPARISMGSGF
jgi:hypothetical protein